MNESEKIRLLAKAGLKTCLMRLQAIDVSQLIFLKITKRVTCYSLSMLSQFISITKYF